MKTLTFELADDQTFNGRITQDGRVIATVSGNVDLVTALGAVHEFTDLLRMLSNQCWHRAQTEPVFQPHTPHSSLSWALLQNMTVKPVRWSIMLPNGDTLDGLVNHAAAVSARAHLRPMWEALVQPPADLYEAFHTAGKGWGFFDREGNLHADFTSRMDAQSHAAKREDADYATPTTTTNPTTPA